MNTTGINISILFLGQSLFGKLNVNAEYTAIIFLYYQGTSTHPPTVSLEECEVINCCCILSW
jgi:hypothetical protein